MTPLACHQLHRGSPFQAQSCISLVYSSGHGFTYLHILLFTPALAPIVSSSPIIDSLLMCGRPPLPLTVGESGFELRRHVQLYSLVLTAQSLRCFQFAFQHGCIFGALHLWQDILSGLRPCQSQAVMPKVKKTTIQCSVHGEGGVG